MKALRTFIMLSLMLTASAVSAQKVINLNLWPNGAPNSNGDSTDIAQMRVYLPQAE